MLFIFIICFEEILMFNAKVYTLIRRRVLRRPDLDLHCLPISHFSDVRQNGFSSFIVTFAHAL